MLDDSIMMAKRLRENGVDVHIDLLDGLAHGFLNFVLVSHDAKHGSNLCMQVKLYSHRAKAKFFFEHCCCSI